MRRSEPVGSSAEPARAAKLPGVDELDAWYYDNRPGPVRVPRRYRVAVAVLLVAVLTLAAGLGALWWRIATPAPVPADHTLPVVIGAVPYWDEAEARLTTEARYRSMTTTSPWSYAVRPDGGVELQPGLTVEGERALHQRWRELGLRVVPTIANTTDGLWDTDTVSRVLGDPALRETHVNSVVALVQNEDFDGIQIDYEDLPAADRDAFSAFLAVLGTGLRSAGKVLYVTVHVKEDDTGYDERNRAQDYAAIGQAADLVCLMAYDWHWSTGPSGPIAPYDWVDRVLRYSVTQIPPQKLVLGVGLFGYDWVETTADNVTWRQVVALAAQHQVDEQWDVGAQSPHFHYTVNGVEHDVWYENGRSVTAKLDLARRYGLQGVEFWRLGGEDPAIWEPGP